MGPEPPAAVPKRQVGPRALVVYDRDCGFCRSTVARLRTLDRSGRLRFRPLQDDRLYAEYPRLTRAACERDLHLVTEDGAIHAGGAAMREVFARVGGAPVTWILALPIARTVVELGYRVVAAERGRIPL